MIKLEPLRRSGWPERDRRLWEHALAPARDLFDDEDGAAARLSACAKRNYERGWGILLAHLAAIGDLDPAASMASRVAPARLNSWIAAMRAAGRENGTIRQYIACAHAIVRLLEPTADVAYVLRPGGQSLREAFPVDPKPGLVIDSEDVMARAREAHREGMAAGTGFARRTKLRDAAFMAMLARRAPRISSAAAMRIGTHIAEQADGVFLVSFPRPDIKTRKRRSWPLDEECSGYMRAYMRIGRPLFPGASTTDALWLGNHGGELDVVGLTGIARRRTRQWFGRECGPHATRKWLQSSAARRSPQAAFDAAEVAGHSIRTALKHYRQADGVGATQRHAAHIRELRRQTAGAAERAFTAMEGRPRTDMLRGDGDPNREDEAA